ncbi:MAG TPA: DUF1203 domain-containing protein [Candidatus Saccharimonadia bacterium]|nr:DUF1203 domain-containing protein [Candidatus Saccharimonadia bacterium]
MHFRLSALPVAPFEHLFGLPDEALRELGVVRRIADAAPGFPCRVSLRDAEPGEPLLLLNHEHLDADSPYRSRHAIYVREHAIQAMPAIDEVPDMVRRRLLSVRAYDRDAMMIAADVAEGTSLEPLLARQFADPAVAFVHLHNARPGCYVARVDRA